MARETGFVIALHAYQRRGDGGFHVKDVTPKDVYCRLSLTDLLMDSRLRGLSSIDFTVVMARSADLARLSAGLVRIDTPRGRREFAQKSIDL